MSKGKKTGSKSSANGSGNTTPEIDPVAASDVVIETAPSFAIASLMIGSAQTQALAQEAGVSHLNQSFQVGLATTTQCVARILDEQSHLLSQMMIANKF